MKSVLIFLFVVCLISLGSAKCSCDDISVGKDFNRSTIVLKGTVVDVGRERIYDSVMLKMFPADSLKFKDYPFSVVLDKYTVVSPHFYKSSWKCDTVQVCKLANAQGCIGYVATGEEYVFFGRDNFLLSPRGKIEYLPKGTGVLWMWNCTQSGLFTHSLDSVLMQYAEPFKVGELDEF